MKVLVAVLAAGMAIVAASQAVADERRVLVIASGEVTGYYYPVAGAFCRVINKDRPGGYTCVVMPTSGSSANVAALRSGMADLAILQSHAALLAADGGDGFKDGPFPDLRALMSLHGESTIVLTRPGSGIEQLADIKDKRVNLGRAGSFQRAMADTVLESSDLSEGNLSAVVELDLGEEGQELCQGNIDVAFFTGVHPMPEVANAIEQCGALPVPIKSRGIDAMAKRTAWLSASTIKGDTYDGVRDEQATLALRAILVGTTRLPAEDVYEIMKAIEANFTTFVRLHPALQGVTKAGSAHDGIAIPLHDGAQKLYGEAGLGK